MPTVRKLSSEEVAEHNAPKLSTRQKVAQEYDQMIGDFVPGDWGELELGDSDSRLTVRSRLLAAAKRHNLGLNFRRTSGNLIRFEVTAVQPEPSSTKSTDSQTAPKKRGRKPRAVAQ